MAVSTYIPRSTKAIVLGLVVAALGAPAARASQPAVTDAVDRYLANHHSHVVAPDDRAGIREVGSQLALPDAIDRYLANRRSRADRGMRREAMAQAVGSSISSSGGFDWGDAGIGAGSASFVSVLAGSALLILLRRRQHV